MQKIISYVYGADSVSGTVQDLSAYAKKTDVTAALADYVKQENYEYDLSKCAKQEDIAEDLVSLTTENARITTRLRNGEEYGWVIDNVANAKNADTATKATCDGKGYNIVNSYTRANSIVTDIAGSDDTLTISYTKNTNGTHSFVSSDIKIDNVEHAKEATKATQDGAGNVIVDTYAKKADLATVATTGSYNDLIDKPTFSDDYTLPIASTTTLGGVKLTEGHFEIGTDGALTVKYATKALWASDAYKAEADVAGNQIMFTYAKNSDLATVATSGSYADLSNKPNLAKVATSGSYSDLTDTPAAYTLPTASASVLGGVKIGSDLAISSDGVLSVSHATAADSATNATNATKATQDASGNVITSTYATKATTLSGYGITDAKIANGTITLGANTITPITSHQSLDDYAKKNTISSVGYSGSYSDLTDTPTIPAKTSELTNDSDFATKTEVQEMIDAITSADGKEY